MLFRMSHFRFQLLFSIHNILTYVVVRKDLVKAGAELMSSAPWYAAFQKVHLGPEVASSSAGVQPMLMTVEIAMKRLQDIYIYIYIHIYVCVVESNIV